ncbi:alpha/beta hydrolase [Pseudogemmobacter sonorensis]|uniref:alpha/beta hydrolase n=1 Tax=Pseudogemmobacter sonorensis TaxID=2989681 RepID=UPI00369AFE6E
MTAKPPHSRIASQILRLRHSRDLPLAGRPCALGLVLGAVFFAASLTPSMIPRAGLMQGVLGGICFAAGYLIAHLALSLWNWMTEAPPPAPRKLTRNLRWSVLIAVLTAGWGLWNATGWQAGIHAVMQLPPVESARPWTILMVASAVAVALVLLGRIFRRLMRLVAAQLEVVVPRRVAAVAGIFAAALLFWSIGNDVVLGRLLALMDDTYAALDDLIPAEQAAPSDPLKSGSAQSLVAWDDLGAAGRDWVLSLPDAGDIAAISGQGMEPLRIYVGLNAAPDAEARAALALEEAIRVGAFEREVLVIATPTGTGWMDPAAFRPLDHLTGGDVATVAVQYSYLPSWLSLWVQPEYGADSARALFHAIHGHWRELPEDSRPRLYLFGLSLGARNGEISATLPDLVAAPPQGALWVGAPFASSSWQQVMELRRMDSPVWAPLVGDGSMIRVTTQENRLDRAAAPWGPMRVVYLEYPSDPIVYFSPSVLWRAPQWLAPPRAPDVSPGLRWFPVVTFLQLAFDMATATSAPPGYGHVYAARDYLTAWDEVLGSETPPERLERLRRMLDADGI